MKLNLGCFLLTLSLFPHISHAQHEKQENSLEQRQPLELIFADSIVPQDRHETMLTTGAWHFRNGALRNSLVTEKIEWGISNALQVSTFVQVLHDSNEAGRSSLGMGDVELGARYTWTEVGSRFTHIAVALDAGFPSGNSRRALGEGTYTISPSVLISREFHNGIYHLFSTSGIEFVAARRALRDLQEMPHSSAFFNSGISRHLGHGWIVTEISVSTNRRTGGDATEVSLTPSYVWRLARRSELLIGIPIGLTTAADHIGGVMKFTFELGGGD